MKDIDDLLMTSSPEPQRPLPSDFAQNVTARLTMAPKNSTPRAFVHRLFPKPALALGLATLVACLAVGTVAAVQLLWPQIKISQLHTNDGTKVVAVDTNNCLYFSALDGTLPDPHSTTRTYYRIVNPSLSDDDVRAYVLDDCLANIDANDVSSIVSGLTTDKSRIITSGIYTVKSIGDNSMSVVHENGQGQPQYTYTISQDTGWYDGREKTQKLNLHVGDMVNLIARNDGALSETSSTIDPMAVPNNVTILAVVKVPHRVITHHEYDTRPIPLSDIKAVEPCKHNPKQFCDL